MLTSYAHLVQGHYGQDDLMGKIMTALGRAGVPPQSLTRQTLAPFEEFHLRGRDGTREIAQLAGLREGMDVLDIGCGIGGPSRTLAAEFGCRVTGIDLVPEFVDTARALSERVGLGDRVQFQQGDALNLPFADASFDAALLEHVNMNVQDKAQLFREAARVLRPGGTLALYEIGAGENAPPYFPVPWATDPQISFLVRPEQLFSLAEEAGLRTAQQRDVSRQCLDWVRNIISGMAGAPADALPLGPTLLMGGDMPQKIHNVMRSLEEDRIRVIEAAFSRRGNGA